MMYDAFRGNDIKNTWMPERKNDIWKQYAVKFAAIMEVDRDIGHITTKLRHDASAQPKKREDLSDNGEPTSKDQKLPPASHRRVFDQLGGHTPKVRDSDC